MRRRKIKFLKRLSFVQNKKKIRFDIVLLDHVVK